MRSRAPRLGSKARREEVWRLCQAYVDAKNSLEKDDPDYEEWFLNRLYEETHKRLITRYPGWDEKIKEFKAKMEQRKAEEKAWRSQ